MGMLRMNRNRTRNNNWRKTMEMMFRMGNTKTQNRKQMEEERYRCLVVETVSS